MATHGLVLAAPSSGAGKTLVTLGLLRALRRAGHAVAGAKSGPDYIDPTYHTRAAGVASVNLDAWAMAPGTIRSLAARQPGSLVLVEGAMGVLDGAGRRGAGSAADLSECLGLPVILVVDAARAGPSAALAAVGLRAVRPDLTLAGVILNRIASDRHASLVEAGFERAGIPVLGRVPRAADMAVPERHLGLVPATELAASDDLIERAADLVGRGVDLERVVAASGRLAPAPDRPLWLPRLPGARVAVAQDAAFVFAYPHLDWGTEPFSPLADEPPSPEADAIFLPGGYPELHAARLSSSPRFRAGLQRAAKRGVPIYGECGGYMVLGDRLVDGTGTAHQMLGLLPVTTSFAERRLSLGYRRLTPLGGPFTAPLRGHEFHYATVVEEGPAARLFEVEDADGVTLPPVGHCRGSVSGSFAHVIAEAPSDDGHERHAASSESEQTGDECNASHGDLLNHQSV
ncbi:MAG: cobyrinate a,c-diamide synthase [Pseudomonadota bacterium]